MLFPWKYFLKSCKYACAGKMLTFGALNDALDSKSLDQHFAQSRDPKLCKAWKSGVFWKSLATFVYSRRVLTCSVFKITTISGKVKTLENCWNSAYDLEYLYCEVNISVLDIIREIAWRHSGRAVACCDFAEKDCNHDPESKLRNTHSASRRFLP